MGNDLNSPKGELWTIARLWLLLMLVATLAVAAVMVTVVRIPRGLPDTLITVSGVGFALMTPVLAWQFIRYRRQRQLVCCPISC